MLEECVMRLPLFVRCCKNLILFGYVGSIGRKAVFGPGTIVWRIIPALCAPALLVLNFVRPS